MRHEFVIRPYQIVNIADKDASMASHHIMFIRLDLYQLLLLYKSLLLETKVMLHLPLESGLQLETCPRADPSSVLIQTSRISSCQVERSASSLQDSPDRLSVRKRIIDG